MWKFMAPCGCIQQVVFGCSDANVYLTMHDPSVSSSDFIVAANAHVIGVTTMPFLYRTVFSLAPGDYTFTLKAKKVNGPTVSPISGHVPVYQSQIVRMSALVIPI